MKFREKFQDRHCLRRPRPSPSAISRSKVPHGLVNFLLYPAVRCQFCRYPAPNHEIQARQHPDRVRFIFGGEFD
jgi:hypothetical protein